MFNVSPLAPVGLVTLTRPPPFIPIAPDYSICDRRYGTHLTPLLCGTAADALIQGNSLVPYTLHGGVPGPHALPYTSTFGNCEIWIEIAGPVTPQVYEAVPNEIRGMAAWLINECVDGDGVGFGGFATKDISKLTAYVTDPDTKVSGTYPASSAFLTVTLTGGWDQSVSPPSPGNYDPSIAQHLAEVEIKAWNKASPGSPLRKDFAARSSFFDQRSSRMRTGGNRFTWWGSNSQVAVSET